MQVRMTQIWISITYRSSVQDSRNWPTSTAITRARVKTTEANLGARIQQHLSFNSYPSEKRKIRGEIKKETRWPLDERIIFTLTERADTIIWFFFFLFSFVFFFCFFVFFFEISLCFFFLFSNFIYCSPNVCVGFVERPPWRRRRRASPLVLKRSWNQPVPGYRLVLWLASSFSETGTSSGSDWCR